MALRRDSIIHGSGDSPQWPSSGSIADGRGVNATNTGIAGKGLVEADLTALAGGVLSTNGTTYYRRLITSTMDVTGNGNTFIECKWRVTAGGSGHAVQLHGTDNTFINPTVVVTGGSRESGFRCWGEAHRTTIRAADISQCENNVGFNDDNTGSVLEESWLHDSNNSTTGGHVDCMEVYGSTNLTIRRNNLAFAAVPTAVINIAPNASGSYVDGVDIYDNFMDGGQNNILVDLQTPPRGDALYLHNVRVYRNWMGGHQYLADGSGPYGALSSRAPNDVTCETLAAQVADPNKVYWPTSGSEANHWWACSDLSPDRTGQIVIP